MRHIRSHMLFLTALSLFSSYVLAGECSSSSCSADCSEKTDHNVSCKPVLLPFSQGESRSRDYATVSALQNITNTDKENWHLDLAVEYNQTWRSKKIGSYLFPKNPLSDDCSNKLAVGPNGAPGVNVRNTDIGLASNFSGTLVIHPKIQNIIVEPQMFIGLDQWVSGMFLWFKVPFVHTRWSLNCCETDVTTTVKTFAPFTVTAGFNNNLAINASGDNQIQQAFSGLIFGDKFVPLDAGKILCRTSKKTGVADLPIHLGFNFINEDRGYLGFYGRVVFPTGTKDDRHSIFDATIGYKRWQLGGGLQGGIKVHEFDEDSVIRAYMDVYVTHMFKKNQCRVFDLKNNGCFSRYLLLEEVDANGNYIGKLANVVDIFTCCVQSQFNWNVDGLFFFNLYHQGWTADLGYEIKVRDKETFANCCNIKLCCPCIDKSCEEGCCDLGQPTLGTNQYGIKGTALLPNEINTDTGLGVLEPAVTQSTSTISTAGPNDAIPQFINAETFASKIDLEGAAIPRALSNKIWGQIGYMWKDQEYPTYASVGGSVELTGDNRTPHVWSVLAKVGLSYN